jgi:hypothetical protein
VTSVFNDVYLVVASFALLLLVTGLLWPDRFPKYSRVSSGDLGPLLIMTVLSLLPGFTWPCRELLLGTTLAHGVVFIRQRRHR